MAQPGLMSGSTACLCTTTASFSTSYLYEYTSHNENENRNETRYQNSTQSLNKNIADEPKQTNILLNAAFDQRKILK